MRSRPGDFNSFWPDALRMNRRNFLRAAAAAGAGTLLPACKKEANTSGSASGATGAAQQEMVQFPEKTNLILLTDRPPQLETPLHYFRQDITPNEAFFVRWHLSMIPTVVDTGTFRLAIEGHVDQEQSLSLEDLRNNFEPFSIIAVNQCSGNSRSEFNPRVPGGQWGDGAMGNAKWAGVRLRDLLNKAKVKDGAVDISFEGLDRGPMPTVPNFVKSLAFDHCMDGEVMVAYEMNGAPLPMLNGFPLRLIVPGWFGTYWVKSLNRIDVLPKKFQGYWMDKGYRVPNTPDAQESPTKLATETVPISVMPVRSLIVKPEAGEKIPFDSEYEVEGIAFDGGKGIREVKFSMNGDEWVNTQLDPELGKYSFRRWRYRWKPSRRGSFKLMAIAANNAGESQPRSQWNRGGYARNVVQEVDVTVA